MIHDAVIITAESHQAIFRAFELISHDGGRQAGHTNYVVPIAYQPKLKEFEEQLAHLYVTADSDFDCFCIGEETERAKITIDYSLQEVDEFLQRFFEEFC